MARFSHSIEQQKQFYNCKANSLGVVWSSFNEWTKVLICSSYTYNFIAYKLDEDKSDNFSNVSTRTSAIKFAMVM